MTCMAFMSSTSREPSPPPTPCTETHTIEASRRAPLMDIGIQFPEATVFSAPMAVPTLMAALNAVMTNTALLLPLTHTRPPIIAGDEGAQFKLMLS